MVVVVWLWRSGGAGTAAVLSSMSLFCYRCHSSPSFCYFVCLFFIVVVDFVAPVAAAAFILVLDNVDDDAD